MGNGKVVIANVHGDDHAPSFTWSMLGLYRFDVANNIGRVETFIASYAGPMQIPKARNDLTAQYLELHDAEWLFFVDSDMGMEANALEMLVASADPVERPVVGGLCYAHKKVGVGDAHAFRGHYLPTVYTWSEDADDFGFNPVYDYPRDALVQTAGTGAACLLIHRRVLAQMADKYGDRQWFRPITYKGRDFSEDMSFSLRCIESGVPMFVNTAVVTSHAKTVHVDQSMYDLLRRNAKRDIAVVVPVKDQLGHTRSLVRQLQVAGNHQRLLIYDNGSGSETKEWLAGQDVAEVFDAEGLNIHEMWNRGIREALDGNPDCDVAILNNDLKLAPDFLARLQDGLRSDPALLAVSANYDGRDFPGLVQPTREICAARYDGTGGFAGFAFMVRNELARTYSFPEELVWWYGDNDLIATVYAEGGWVGIAKHAKCVHVDGGSVTSKTLDQSDFAARCQQDREWFLNKWNGGDDDAPDDGEHAATVDDAAGFLDVGGRH